MRTRLRREEAGFGLIELVIAMAMLNIGLLALIAAFNSGALALQRASRLSTASVLADSQMELYRAILYTQIGLSDVATADGDLTYRDDVARGYPGTTMVSATCTAGTFPNQCDPIQPVQGPDSKEYRVDTYISEETPVGGSRTVKVVTVVVRDQNALSKTYVRQQTTFDQSTGV